jgi:response regulator NasT
MNHKSQNPVLRVMLVDDVSGRAAILERALRDNGYDVVARVGTDENLLRHVDEIRPDIIIIDMESPDRDILEHMRMISRDKPKPIVMFAEKSDGNTIEQAVRAGVSAYIVDGLSENRLKPIMDVAIARFREFHALKEELQRTKTDLADRKDIDKAKGIIMRQRQCDEAMAYATLRKMAMDTNKKLGDVARNIIEVAELFG